ncbi:MAG: zinc ribbon domain-containing protein [Sulfolobales archaeon]
MAWDDAHKMGDSIAELADKHDSIVVLENLSKLKNSVKRSRTLNKRLSLWFYRKVQFAISYEAIERGLETKYINSRKTSSTCPKCRGRLKDNGGRALRCSGYGFTGDRDEIACVNLFLRYARCWVPGVAPSALEPYEDPSGMRGERDEAMKSTNISLYES